MRKILWGLSIIIAIAVVVFACKKNDTSANQTNPGFDVATAKEWYYGTFKKSGEWNSSPEKGKKLPDWKGGKSKKFGAYEVVDFPIVKEKSTVAFLDNADLTEGDKRKVATASIFRIAFIKNTNGKIDTREITYIPDMDYLVRHNYDISNNSFADIDDDFSGMMVVKKWSGTEISRSLIKEGKIIKRLKKQNTDRPNIGARTANMICIIEWAQDCETHLYGDGLFTEECGEWYQTGNRYCFDDGEGGDPCAENPESPACTACVLYGIGCDEEGGGDEENCSEIANALQANTADEFESSTTTEIDATTREKKYVWKCLIAPTTLVYWKSLDKSIQIKVGNEWRFQSLEHTDLEKYGTQLGVTYNATVTSWTPSVGLYNSIMALHIHYTADAICRGFPVGTDDYFNPAHLFTTND